MYGISRGLLKRSFINPIYETHSLNNITQAADASYTVQYDGSTASFTVNQEVSGGQWNLLGSFPFASGSSGSVTLTDVATGPVAADAVMLREVIDPQLLADDLYYYHADHLGTPQVMTDQAGVVAWNADHEPFGEAQVLVASVENNFRFPGQYFDEETGDHYNWHRYYGPELGGQWVCPGE